MNQFTIKSAKACGYIVVGQRTREMYEDHVGGELFFAGTLEDCLSYIKQEIVKHDEWRNEAERSFGIEDFIKASKGPKDPYAGTGT